MRRFLFSFLLLLGTPTFSLADRMGDAFTAYKQGDFAKAAELFKDGAERGDTEAQFNLGWMYDQGRGVPQDYVLAHMWLNLAASQSVKNAATLRDATATKMTPEQLSQAQTLAREWVAKHQPQ